MSRTLKSLSLALVLATLAVGCDDEKPPFQDRHCGDKVILRCRWNAATMKYDLECVTIPADAGTATCDGGAPG